MDAGGADARDGRHGDEPETSGAGCPPPPFLVPSRNDPRWEGVPRTRACARGPSPPPTTTDSQQLRTSGGTTSSAPRDPSPSSERGGAGRRRRERANATRRKGGRVASGHPRGPSGRNPSRSQHTLPKIAREGLSHRGRDGPNAASPGNRELQRHNQCRKQDPHAAGCTRGGACGIGKGILSVRGQRRPATGIPREPGLAKLTQSPHRARTAAKRSAPPYAQTCG